MLRCVYKEKKGIWYEREENSEWWIKRDNNKEN
jgi:hypothetical protein